MTSRTCISERLRLPVISAVAVSVLALAGCSGGGDPQAGPTASAVASQAQSASGSATATPSATAKPKPVYKPADAKGRAQNVPVPVKPALADKNSKEGLEAFTKYWFALLNYGYETGDLKAWSALTAASCTFCSNVKTSVAVGYRSGRWQVGGRLSTPSVQSNFKPNSATQQVAAQVIQEVTQYYKADKSVGRSPEPGTNTGVVVIAIHSKGEWSVSDMHLVQ